MNILPTLKKIFPMPVIPQKRYLAIIGLVGYYALKAYVSITPSPADDNLPDEIRQVVSDVID